MSLAALDEIGECVMGGKPQSPPIGWKNAMWAEGRALATPACFHVVG